MAPSWVTEGWFFHVLCLKTYTGGFQPLTQTFISFSNEMDFSELGTIGLSGSWICPLTGTSSLLCAQTEASLKAHRVYVSEGWGCNLLSLWDTSENISIPHRSHPRETTSNTEMGTSREESLVNSSNSKIDTIPIPPPSPHHCAHQVYRALALQWAPAALS